MITVSVAGSDQYQEALSLLWADCPVDQRAAQIAKAIESATCGDLCLEGLLLAEVSGKPAGALMYILQEDGTAFVWPPVTCDDIPPGDVPPADVPPGAVADALLEELCRKLDRADAWLGQCVVERHQTHSRAALVRNGFGHLADLNYLERRLSEALPAAAGIDFETETYDSQRNEPRFARILERTYVGTLDCPSLNDSRSGTEALAGHRFSGEFQPNRWTIFRYEQADVGILLFNGHPEQNAWEVVYIGVVPESRGLHFGREMLLWGLQEAKNAGQESILLAVDQQNEPALRMYRELGFFELAMRAVHIRRNPNRPAKR